jgi:hypothetical protein
MKLQSLPNQILDAILSFCSMLDLKSLRLVSSFLIAPSSRLLFRNISMCFYLASVERLTSIAKSRHATSVRQLKIHTAILPEFTNDHALAMTLDRESDDYHFFRQANQASKDAYIKEYKEQLDSQARYLVDKSFWQEIQRALEAMTGLRNLEMARYELGCFERFKIGRFMSSLPMWQLCHYMSHEGLEESRDVVFTVPEGISFDQRLMSGIIGQVALPSVSQQLRKLRYQLTMHPPSSNIDITTRAHFDRVIMLVHVTKYPLLTSLDLEIVLSGALELDIKLLTAVHSMLASATGLKSLTLDICCADVEVDIRGPDHLESIATLRWPNLETLWLSCSTTKQSLLAFLSQHHGTLKSLRLIHMRMLGNDGGWKSFLNEIPKLSNLETLELFFLTEMNDLDLVYYLWYWDERTTESFRTSIKSGNNKEAMVRPTYPRPDWPCR